MTRLQQLPPIRQEEAASWLLAELEDEDRWAASLARSAGTLEALADEALDEHRADRTQELDFSRS